MAGKNTLPVRSGDYVRGLEEVRRYLGLGQDQAAVRAGVTRETWNRIVCARPRRGNEGMSARPSFDALAAMADGLGMTFVLAPIGTLAPGPEAVPAEVQQAERMEPEPVPAATEYSRSIMARLRQARRDRGVWLKDMAGRLGMGEHRCRAIERGHREPGFGDVARYAEEIGLSVTFAEPEAAPLATLDAKEADAVKRLVISYVSHCIREQTPIPAGLLDAAEKLEEETA